MKAKTDSSPKKTHVLKYTFVAWDTPNRLIMHPDGTLAMKDGSDVQEYLRQWMEKMGQKEATDVVLMTREYAEMINMPHCG